MSPLIVNIVGYAAAICMVCGYLPQAIYTIRTRDTDGIAMRLSSCSDSAVFSLLSRGLCLKTGR